MSINTDVLRPSPRLTLTQHLEVEFILNQVLWYGSIRSFYGNHEAVESATAQIMVWNPKAVDTNNIIAEATIGYDVRD